MPSRLLLLLMVGLVACAGAGATRDEPATDATRIDDDGTLSRGGELRVEQMPPATVQASPEGLVVWAMTELPGASRMQAAHAAIDAIVRAELAKYLEVRIATAMKDVITEDSQSVVLKSSEAVRAQLRGTAPIQHGWSKVQTETTVVLRLVARMQVPAAMLATAVTSEPTLGAESERVMRALMATEAGP